MSIMARSALRTWLNAHGKHLNPPKCARIIFYFHVMHARSRSFFSVACAACTGHPLTHIGITNISDHHQVKITHRLCVTRPCPHIVYFIYMVPASGPHCQVHTSVHTPTRARLAQP